MELAYEIYYITKGHSGVKHEKGLTKESIQKLVACDDVTIISLQILV